MIFLFCDYEMLIYNSKFASFWYTSDCFDEYNLNL